MNEVRALNVSAQGFSKGSGGGQREPQGESESTSEPVERASLCMRDCEHESVRGMHLERDDIRKPIDDRSPDAQGCLGRPWPNRKRCGAISDPIERRRHFGNQLVAQPGALLIVPDGRRAKLCSRLRMKLDAHDAPRALSGAPPALCPTQSSGPSPPRPRSLGAPARAPMPPQSPARRCPPGWRALPPLVEPALGGGAGAPMREVLRSTYAQRTTARLRRIATAGMWGWATHGAALPAGGKSLRKMPGEAAR